MVQMAVAILSLGVCRFLFFVSLGKAERVRGGRGKMHVCFQALSVRLLNSAAFWGRRWTGGKLITCK